MSGRADRPVAPSPRSGLLAALGVAAVVFLLDLFNPPRGDWLAMLVALPFLAAAFASWRSVLILGGGLTTVAAAWGAYLGHGWTTDLFVQLGALMLATFAGATVGALRDRTTRRMVTLSRLADVAQQAVLRPMAPKVGGLSVAVRYVSASAEADIGGDLYEAVDTPYGVRLIVGDVRGKGLDAVRLASTVLGSYRHVAYERADLRAVVSDLDRAVSRSVGIEDFVTAAIVEERGGTLTVVNCGHPPPLLLRRGEVITLDPPTPAPPLGFLPVVQPRVERLEPGDRLLLYTDGLAEARRDGEFFPVRERAWSILGHGTVEDGLTSLESALSAWVRSNLEDDIALVLVEYVGASPAAVDQAVPAWEWDRALGG